MVFLRSPVRQMTLTGLRCPAHTPAFEARGTGEVMQSLRQSLPADDQGTAVRAFLIADIRGYSTFTREQGHAEAAKLAAKFVDLASDAIEANGGRVVEIRGDEVLAVFGSPLSAARAGVALQLACREESALDPTLPVPAGVGVDAGESVRSGEQYHGSALNMAARLCAKAGAGEVLLTRSVADRCVGTSDLVLEERGTDRFKGFDAPVEVIAVRAAQAVEPVATAGAIELTSLPRELDPLTPMVDRQRELHWLRGTWRSARRGRGRVVFVSGQTQIGKTRLAAALAGQVLEMGGTVRYAGPGGTAAADALAGVGTVLAAHEPMLLVLDDLDTTGQAPVRALAEGFDAIAGRPVLVACLIQESDRTPELTELVVRADEEGNGHRILTPLRAEGVQEIARLYAGQDLAAVPVESVIRASGGVPGRIHEVMSEWAREETSRRLTAASEYLAAGQSRRSADLDFANNVIGLKLGQLYSGEAPSTPADLGQCPYKGLAPFRGADAGDFFGRERLVGELAARSVQFGLLGVVGDSGSGKSSVIAAGLLPSLRAGLLPGSERWQQVSMRPGEHPMSELLATSRILVPDAGTDAFEQATRAVGADGRLILFVDQCEELFTVCSDESERVAFLDALTAAARSPEHFLVVIALRGDFYGACARYPEFSGLLAANHVPVGPMTSDELRRAIELPARRATLRTESALVDELLDDVADQPGALPLLSTALVELWQQRGNGWLRLEAYRRTDGIRGAVARLAEATYEQLTDEERETARRIFLRLVGPGEGDAVTRRRAPISEFDLDRDPIVKRVMDRFTTDRLLTTSASTVEVAHEALLREWPRLRGWIEEDLQGHQLRQHLTQAARQWESSGREQSELYRGARLSATLDWSASHGQDLNETERAFVQESRQAGEAETRRVRRTNRRLRGLLVGAAIFLMVALIAGSVAFVQRGHARSSAAAAERQATIALSRSLAARAVVEPRLDTAMLLAVEGAKLDTSVQSRSGLLSTLLRGPSALGIYDVSAAGAGKPRSVTISPDGKTMVVFTGGQLIFFDLATRQPVGTNVEIPSEGGFGSGINFIDDGTQIRVNSFEGDEIHVDASTHRILRRSKASTCEGPPFAADGRTVIVEVDDDAGSRLERCDPATERVVRTIHLVGSNKAMASIAATKKIFTLTDLGGGTLEVRNSMTLAVEKSYLVSIPRDDNPCWLAGAPNGQRAAIACYSDNQVRFVDMKSGAVTVGTPSSPQNLVGFTLDARTFVSWGFDEDTLLWNPATGEVAQRLTGQGGSLTSATLDEAGTTLYTASLDRTIYAWDLTGTRGFGRPLTVGNGGMVHPFGGYMLPFFSASSDGTRIAVPQNGGIVNIVDLASGEITTSFQVPGEASLAHTEFSPDGSQLLVSPGPDSDGRASLWHLGGGAPSLVRTFPPMSAIWQVYPDTGRTVWFFPWATFSPDGKWIAGVDTLEDGTSHLFEWNAATGAQRVQPLEFSSNVGIQTYYNAAFSPDGSIIATGTPADEVLIVNASTLKIMRRLASPDDTITWVSFSPDGRYLATGAGSGTVRLWSTSSWTELGHGVQAVPGSVNTVEFDPTNTLLIATGHDGTTRMWTVPGLQAVGAHFPRRSDAAASLDAASLFVGDDLIVRVYAGGQATLWPATLVGWERHACQIAGRNLTQAEWNLFVGSDRPYRKTCPEF